MNRLVLLALGLFAARPSQSAADPPPPPVELGLRVEASSANEPWKLVITNTSGKAVRFAADSRLFRLEIDNPAYDPEATRRPRKGARAEPKTIECRLPEPMLPGRVAEDRAVYLAPGARYEETIDPALYCFGQREREALGAGAKITPKLGFALSKAASATKPLRPGKIAPPPPPPFVAEPTVSGASVSPAKEIVGEAFTLPSIKLSPTPAAATEPDPQDPDAPRLEISTPARVDAFDSGSIEMPVTVRNVGKRRALLRLRRDNAFFDVEGPAGSFRCGALPVSRTIPSDLFSPLQGGASETLSIRLAEPCPDKAFDRPGIYRVRAMLVMPDPADRYGAHPWTGRVEAGASTLLRVRTGPLPFHQARPAVRTE